jgi:regulator of sigma E protease
MSLIIFIIILSILVLVHEWGHYITARKCGVKVDEFALGFGPKLWSKMHDGTEFKLCAIPLGGYVKMAGDERDKCTGSREEFFSQSVGHRALVVLMGPVVNLVLAYVCFWAVFTIGFPDMEASAKRVEPRVGQIVSGSPADKAGLKTGDKVLTIDGKKVNHWPDLQDNVMASTAPVITVTLERDGKELTKTITPNQHTQKDIFGREHHARRIGVGPVQIKDSQDVVIVRYNPIEALGRAATELGTITVKTYSALYEMLIGLRSPKEAMGIVGMFYVIKFAITIGFSFLLHIVGVISASLALFNLLPLIPLDGGHLVLLGIEKIRRKALSVKVDQFIARFGFGLILALALFIFYVDFERIGLIDKVMKVFNG